MQVAGGTSDILLSTAVTLLATDNLVRIADKYEMPQHLVDGPADLLIGRGSAAPVCR